MLDRLHDAVDFLVDYRFGEDALEITSLGGAIVTRRFPYASMREVKRGHETWNEHYQTRFSRDKLVSIRLDRTLIPWLVLTPEDPTAFIAEIEKRMGRG